MQITKLLASAFLLFSALNSNSQTAPFEGIIRIKTDFKSKSQDMGDEAMRTVYGVTPETVIYTKNKNQRQSNAASDTYFIGDDKKMYLKFKRIDTLYEFDYATPSPKPTTTTKTSEKKTIMGYDCEVFLVKSEAISRKFYYSPQLRIASGLYGDLENGYYDVYADATSSMWLAMEEESSNFRSYHEAISVKSTSIPDSIFKLPSLPRAPFEISRLLITPTYDRNGGWANYIQKNINVDLAAKHVKIPRGETSGLQSVLVKFLVTENGLIENARVVNTKDVHPKLAQEAIRVVTESGRWTPATVYGIKIPFTMQQPVTFVISK